MIEIRLLRQFVVVAEELHFGRAAVRLHMAQPPLSQAMLKLEERVGVPLLERNSRRVSLTRAGESLLERTREILALLDAAVDEARRVACADRALVVSGVQFRGYEFLLAALRGLCEGPDAAQVSLKQGPTAEQVAWLNSRSTDVAFLRGIDDLGPDVRYERVAVERLYAVLGASHRLARVGELALADLSGEAFVLPSRRLGVSYHRHLLRLCEDAGFTPAIAHEVENMQTLVGLVEAGMGVSIVPASVVAHSDGVRFVNLVDASAQIPLFMAWQGEPANPLRDAFIAAVRRRKPQAPLWASPHAPTMPERPRATGDARPASLVSVP